VGLDQDGRALGGEDLGDPRTGPPERAGHERHLAGQTEIHAFSLADGGVGLH
jgi:hypothetical protein